MNWYVFFSVLNVLMVVSIVVGVLIFVIEFISDHFGSTLATIFFIAIVILTVSAGVGMIH